MEEKRKVSVGKIIAISAGVAVAVAAILFAAYKFCKKYFKFTLDCGDCSECEDDCFDIGYIDEDEDCEPACALDDVEAEEEAEA